MCSLRYRAERRREGGTSNTRLSLVGDRSVGAGLLANPVNQHRIQRLTHCIRQQAGSYGISRPRRTGQSDPRGDEAVNQIPLSAKSIAKYVKIKSAPARLIAPRVSRTTRCSSMAPAWAPNLIIAYSPLT